MISRLQVATDREKMGRKIDRQTDRIRDDEVTSRRWEETEGPKSIAVFFQHNGAIQKR